MPANHQSVYVIRHGETEWSISGQHTGVTDIPLTDNGRNLAKLLQPVLAKQSFVRVFTSPLQRARATCEIAGLGDKAELVPELIEWNYGEYEGLTTPQIHEQSPDWFIFTDGCPGGEMPYDVGIRVDHVIAKIRVETGDVVLFAHGHVLRVFVARWLGLAPSAGRHFLLDTGTLNILSYYQGSPVVKRWNAQLLPS